MNSCEHMISGFRRDADEVCALLEYYAAFSDSSVPTFRDNLSVPSSAGLLDHLVSEEKKGDSTTQCKPVL
jgi:hypothetical protein